MKTNIHQDATAYINSLPRIQNIGQEKQHPGDVLLLPADVVLQIDNNSNAILSGFSDACDPNAKDILRVIELHDAINLHYTETSIISPSMYVHSVDDKPWHITTQCIIVTHLSKDGMAWVAEENNHLDSYYSKHEMDHFWLPCSRPLSAITESDVIYILNRRVSGWDGSPERPVIELLGAGGHLQAIWNGNKFVSRDLKDNLKKEFSEEIGLDVREDDIQCIGGFENKKTHELVVLFCVLIDERKLPEIHQHALGNVGEDTDGLYLGVFSDVIDQYRTDPLYFAGGCDAAPTNFPNNSPLMQKCLAMIL